MCDESIYTIGNHASLVTTSDAPIAAKLAGSSYRLKTTQAALGRIFHITKNLVGGFGTRRAMNEEFGAWL